MPYTTDVTPRALKTPEAAKYLGLSPKTLRAWRLRGPEDPGTQGPSFIRISDSCVLYELRELDAWLNAHRSATAACA